ncbi:hypothetical protein [Brucella pseudogrignonensis]|uniref:Uncharacterized protein n=1 Tax=Brucella pseudogrignonensis TaxID=419475 RepID=A0ABU1MF24_9HYPH|nr:hypothetical protein [Brucella pseudogrignonensis]MDR6434634.1 hypothetical protein [Brucella pseudogrignonensis]
MATLNENLAFRQAKEQIILQSADEARDFNSFRKKLAEQGVLIKLVLRERHDVEFGKPTKHRAVSFTDLNDHAGFAGQDIDLSVHLLISKFGEPNQDWYQTPGYYAEWQEQKQLFPELAKVDQEAAAQFSVSNKEYVQLERAQKMLDRPEQVPDEIDQFTYYDTLEKIGADVEGPESDFGVYNVWTKQKSSDLALAKTELDKSINSKTMKRLERGARIGLFKEAREKKDLEHSFKAQQVTSKAYALHEDRKTMIYLASEKKKLDRLLADTKPETPERKFVVEQIALLEMKAGYAKFASEFRSREINAVFKDQGKALNASNVREGWLELKAQAKRDWTEAFSGKAAAARAYREMREDNKLIVAKTLKYAMTSIKPKEPMRFEAWLYQQEMTPHVAAAVNGMQSQRMTAQQRVEDTKTISQPTEISFFWQKKSLSDEKIAMISNEVAEKLYGDKPTEISSKLTEKGREKQQDETSPEVTLLNDDTLNKNTKQQGERIARDATMERVSENTEDRKIIQERKQAEHLVKEQENRSKELKENKSQGKKPVLKLTKPI